MHEKTCNRRNARSADRFLGFHTDWIRGQRIGAIAWAIVQIDTNEGPEQAARLDDLASNFNREANRLGLRKRPELVANLPLSTLEICSNSELRRRLPKQKFLLSKIQGAANWYRRSTMLEREDKFGNLTELNRCSPAEGAELIAQMVMFSDLPAESIVNALSFFFDDVFRKMQADPGEVKQLQMLVDQLRNPRSTTEEAVAIVNRTGTLLLSWSRKAIALKNALLDALLFWPLLIYDRERRSFSKIKNTNSFSFPVIVDIKFDGQSTVGLNPGGRVPGEVYKRFHSQVVESFEAAKQLWRSKNGFARRRWDEVRGASITVDFRVASEICRGAGIDPLWRDRSAEAYFVQAFLTRLIGRNVSLNVGLSGRLGPNLKSKKREQVLERLPNDFSIADNDESAAERFVTARREMERQGLLDLIDTGDLSFDRWMQGIDRSGDKYKYAASSGKFRKLILHPDDAISDSDSKNLPYLEVNYVRTISAAADAAQLGGWRPHRYFRSPDIGHLIHRDPSLMPRTSHPLVSETRLAMKQNNDIVCRLGDEHSVLSVASILQTVNFSERFDQIPVPPGLSWAFLRVEENERNLRFWHSFLDVLGASDLAIQEHFVHADNEFTAGLISSILTDGEMANRLGCYSPPDIVIIFSASNAIKAGATEMERESLPLDFERVLESISGKTKSELRAPYSRMIGGSRIVVLDGDVRYMNRAYFNALANLSSVDSELLNDLSIFDFGFTVQMAYIASLRGFLNMNHAKAELERHVRAGILWKFGQLYFVPHALRSAVADASYDEALRSKRVANALMPGIGQALGGGFSPAECLRVEQVREAQRYMDKAKDKATRARWATDDPSKVDRLRGLVRQIGAEQDLHSRFFDMPTWGVVHKLAGNSAAFSAFEVLAYAENNLRRTLENGVDVLPAAYTLTIRAARNAVVERYRQNEPNSVIELKQRIDSLFDEAESAARLREDADERDDWLVHVLSWKSGYIDSFRKLERGGIKRLAGDYPDELVTELEKEILELLDQDVLHGISPDCATLLRLGDWSKSAESAKAVYFATARLSPNFYGTYPRLFGLLDGDERRSFLAAAPGRQFWTDRVSEALEWASNNRKYLEDSRLPSAIRQRIQIGLDRMSKYRK